MKQPRLVLAKIISERTKRVADPIKLAQEIAAYLVAENRTGDLTLIMRDVLVLRKEQGIIEADVVSAHELDAVALFLCRVAHHSDGVPISGANFVLILFLIIILLLRQSGD